MHPRASRFPGLLLSLVLAVGCSPTVRGGAGDVATTPGPTSSALDSSPAASSDTSDCDTPTVWFADQDGDGYGDPAQSLEACEAPSGMVASKEDCNDQDPGLFPEDGLCAAGRTCLDWLAADPTLPDGSYAVDPDGSGVGLGPVLAFCNMDWGGWTLVGLQTPEQALTRTAADIGLGEDWDPSRTHRWGTARIQSVAPTTAWRITSTNADGLLVDDAWFMPTCVIDWEAIVGTWQNKRDAQDDACGIAWTDQSFTEILGGSYTENNCALGIGQNNYGRYCSIRMGSCNCDTETCDSTWAPEEGLATPCQLFEYASYEIRLWVQ